MQIHLLSSRSSDSRTATGSPGSAGTGPGHPLHLPDDLGAALRAQGHQVEISLLGDALNGAELTSLRDGATAGRRLAPELTGPGAVLHALDPPAWAAALTARSLREVRVVLRLTEPAPAGDSPLAPDGARDRGPGRVTASGSPVEQRAYRACLRAADAVAAVDDGDRRAAVRAGVPGERALVVPDVVGRAAAGPSLGSLHPGRDLLSLNGVGQGSGIGTLLAAVRRLPGQQLVVAGSGSAQEELRLRRELKALDLTGRVRWLGWVGRAATVQLIDAAALVVLPGPAAGPTAAIEAMSRSRAVATVAGGPAAGVVVDGVTGVVTPDDADLLGAGLRAVLGNPFLLAAMGLAGQERALARYTPARAVSATEHVYRVALGAA